MWGVKEVVPSRWYKMGAQTVVTAGDSRLLKKHVLEGQPGEADRVGVRE